MKEIKSQADFEAVLRAERAVLFLDFGGSATSRAVVEEWVRMVASRPTKVDWQVHRLAPDEQTYTWKWIGENGAEIPGGGEGAVLWLKAGKVVARVSSAADAGAGGLTRATRRWFPWPEAPEGSADRHAEECPCDPALLEVMCCPETHQGLTAAGSQSLEKINTQIDAGLLKRRDGQPVRERLEGGLVRADGKMMYPVRNGIPIMLIDEGIPLS